MFRFFKRTNKAPRDELNTILGGYELPSFSTSVMNVLSKLRDPEISMAELVPMIELDPGMTVRILRLVNSAGFGLTTKANNLQHAVMLMGHSRLEALVLSFGVSDSLPSSMQCIERGMFWAIAARRASLARMIAALLHPATQAECFTAGLLMDMAISVLDPFHKGKYCEVITRWRENDETGLVELERERFGYDHADIGGLMAEAWKLPKYIVNAIAAHHRTDGKVEPAIRLVALLKYFDEENQATRLIETACEEYGMERATIEEMVHEAFAYAEEFTSAFH